jgi:hypothetical protein
MLGSEFNEVGRAAEPQDAVSQKFLFPRPQEATALLGR